MNMNDLFCANESDSKIVCEFFENCEKAGAKIHSLKVICNSKTLVRAAKAPYTGYEKMQLYSLSKSFSSTAIGFLVSDGKLSLDEKIVDIFKDRIDDNVCENAKEMTVRHVLSMNTGHEQCLLEKINQDDDIIRAWLSYPVEHKPGTHFCYNNAATYALSEIVRKYTGLSMFDFLSVRMFLPLDMHGLYWDRYKLNSQGAIGLHASVDDVAKLGCLYLNGGVYKGKRLLAKKWVDDALSVHSDNSENGSSDWTSGYGYQFWKNSREGFRADGAFGQLCIILPQRNSVIAVRAQVSDMQKEIDCVFDLADKLSLKSDEKKAEEKSGNGVKEEKVYKLEENPLKITLMYFSKENDKITWNFSNGEKWQAVTAKKGCYTENEFDISALTPSLYSIDSSLRIKHVKCAAHVAEEDNKIRFILKYLDNPHTDIIEFEINENTVEINLKDRLDTAFQIEKIIGNAI